MLNRGIVFLLDVDNTLLDNDRFGADLGSHLEECFGAHEVQPPPDRTIERIGDLATLNSSDFEVQS